MQIRVADIEFLKYNFFDLIFGDGIHANKFMEYFENK